VGYATLNRFYSLHYLLPFIILALSITHLIALHDTGGSNNLGITSNKALIPFHPYFTYKDILGFILYLSLFSLFLFFYPYYLGLLAYILNYMKEYTKCRESSLKYLKTCSILLQVKLFKNYLSAGSLRDK
jgi:quinol-cytochrome oxidoreductase complex cytochrome b subunit